MDFLETDVGVHLTLIAAAAALAVGGVSGWTAQGWRLAGEIESLKHGQTKTQLNGVAAVATDLAETHGRFVDALQQFQSTQQANQLAQQDLGRVLLDLRGFTSGLRGDFANLPGRIERASQATLGQYASTCTDIFEAMAAGGGRLAEAGAGIAAKADGHAADVRLTQDAWPK